MLVLIAVAENRMLNLWGSCKGWDLTPHFTTCNLIMRFLEEILTLEIQAEALQAGTRILFFTVSCLFQSRVMLEMHLYMQKYLKHGPKVKIRVKNKCVRKKKGP